MSQAQNAPAVAKPAPVLSYETPATAEASYSADSWSIHKWAMGCGADYWMYSQFALISLAYTTGFKLDVRLVGIALFFPRIVDGVVDPIVGHLSDNTHSKWGRRRPFLLATAILGALLVMAIWLPSASWPTWVRCMWLTIGATLLFSVWGTYAMAHQAMGCELSDDYNDRSRVFAIKNFYWSIMSLMGGFYYSTAILLGNGVHKTAKLFGRQWNLSIPSVGGEVNGLRILSVGIAGIILASACIVVFSCRERFVNANRKHVNLWRACVESMKCRPFVMLLLLQVCRGFGSVSGLAISLLAICYVCEGNKLQAVTVNSGIGGIMGLLFATTMWPITKPLTKHIGKRMGIFIGGCTSLLGAVIGLLVTRPGWVYGGVIVGFVLMLPNMIGSIFWTAVIPDICDMDELAYGERREGLFSAVQSCLSKWENSVMNLVGAGLVWLSGYNKDVDLQSPIVIKKLLWFAYTPLIFFAAVSLVIAWYIPISEKMMKEVRAKLDARRAAAANAWADLPPVAAPLAIPVSKPAST